MSSLAVNGINIEYQTFGDRTAPPLLLVMGLGAQMIHWDDEFCLQLAGNGFHVIRYDNRDVGLSSKMDNARVPDLAQIYMDLQQGKKPDVDYTVEDMANDGIALLDALNLDTAHICGASMGGMIVQTMAINHTRRVRSVTSIMSTTGNPELPPATAEATAALLAAPAQDRDLRIEQSMATQRTIGSPGFPFDEDRARQKATLAYDRCFYPQGVARQMAAIVAQGDRSEGLLRLDIPALVIHGKADPLVPVDGGIDTHEKIRGSKLLLIDGMGHDLPPQTWDTIIPAITEISRADQG